MENIIIVTIKEEGKMKKIIYVLIITLTLSIIPASSFAAQDFLVKNVVVKVIKELLTLGCIALIALMPLIWYRIALNHSYVHLFFTYKVLFISFFAVFSLLFKLGHDVKLKKE